MLKVLIADDEPKICQLVKSLVDWDTLGMSVCDIVHNGIDAYDSAISLKPDIIITDIYMPGLDGIELIQKLKMLDLDINFIIISGYRDFKYAHSALKFGVDDYLLKPIKEKELVSTLKMICSKYQKKQDLMQQGQQLEQIEKEMKVKLQQNYINELLSDTLPKDNRSLEYFEKILGRKTVSGTFQAVIVKTDKNPVHQAAFQYQQIQDKVGNFVDSFFAPENILLLSIPMEYGYLSLLNFSSASMIDPKSLYKTLFNKISCDHNFFGIYDITISFGRLGMNFEDISDCIRSAISGIESRIVLGTDKIIDISKYQFKPMNSLLYLTAEKEFQITNLFISMDISSINEFFSDLSKSISEDSTINPSSIFWVVRRILNIFIYQWERMNSYSFDPNELHFQFNRDIYCTTSISELFHYTNELIIDIIRKNSEQKESQEKKFIKVAKQYIQENFSKQLSLEDIAAKVNFNPVYFCSIFKKETGISAFDYLTSCRIDVAKNLLKKTDESIYNIALQVGYNDQKYFSNLFRKVVGISPSKFRVLYS